MHFLSVLLLTAAAFAQPTVSLPGLNVRTVASGLSNPTSLAFLGNSTDFLVLEKNTGRVRYFENGQLQNIALDLAVNNASERGLLGIAVHPRFPQENAIFLYWTCVAVEPAPAWTPGQPPPAFVQPQMSCADSNRLGADSSDILRVPVLGNRVDRFRWNPDTHTLTYDSNLISLRAFQNDGTPNPMGSGPAQPPRGNHNGGVLRFSDDGRLFVYVGDAGRRGLLQNLAQGPNNGASDDQFGGPAPDDAHLSGVILRLNTDGSAPVDNPFYFPGAQLGGSAGLNLQKVYAYGIRNGFGMAIDPATGDPWITEHGDDAFDEINRVRRGMNGGWVQLAGPSSRYSQFRDIENTFLNPQEMFPSLQQWRFPPSQLAEVESQARARLVMLPGSQYVDPEFSWKYSALPNSLAFVQGSALGPDLENTLLVSLAGRPMSPGYLLRFPVIPGQGILRLDDPNLQDRVADNYTKYDLTESESLIIGSGFGIATDMRTSPTGSVYIVSFSNGKIYEIFRAIPL
ncbi:MAG: PQQ-dependent sugar dehydrogenase [Bryobacterales bacterium]|nr:PQQ-dependent sugar dehydrogenase [Bryobacterales bacterium]